MEDRLNVAECTALDGIDQAAHPLMPLGLFRSRNLSVANIAGVLWAAAMFAWFFLSALYLQLVLNYTPMEVGLAFLPGNLIMGAFSLGLSAKLVTRFGIRGPLAVGLLLAAAGLALFARAPVDGTFWIDVMPGMTLLGLGAGIAFNPILLGGDERCRPERVGLASGVVNTSFMMGGALGLAILASLSAARTHRSRVAAGAAMPSRSARAPSIEELYANGPHAGTQAFEVGDPNLDPEKSIGIEASIRKHSGPLRLTATAYYNRFSNFIFQTPTGEIEDDLPVYQYLQGKANYYGFEVEANAELEAADAKQLLARAVDVPAHAGDSPGGAGGQRARELERGAEQQRSRASAQHVARAHAHADAEQERGLAFGVAHSFGFA